MIFSGEPTSTEWSSIVGTKRKRSSRRPVDVKKGDMLNETRKLLEDFYRQSNEEMFRATGDIIFLYS